MNFTVCISVYRNDNASHFDLALDSVINNTTPPTELVLVVDGPVPNTIESVIEKWQAVFHNFTVKRLEKNQGHAIARQTGIDLASYNLIALMDSDDISVSDRFEKQIEFLTNNTDVDIVGGQIYEFIETTDNVVGIRDLPLDDDSLKVYLRSRCPFNQMTVMMRKSKMKQVGGYIDWFCNEDYYLWIRMAMQDCRFANLADNLVNVRVGADMYARRGGWRYFKSEAKLQGFMLEKGIISMPKYIINVTIRLIVQVLMPNAIRGFIFQKLFRKKQTK